MDNGRAECEAIKLIRVHPANSSVTDAGDTVWEAVGAGVFEHGYIYNYSDGPDCE